MIERLPYPGDLRTRDLIAQLLTGIPTLQQLPFEDAAPAAIDLILAMVPRDERMNVLRLIMAVYECGGEERERPS